MRFAPAVRTALCSEHSEKDSNKMTETTDRLDALQERYESIRRRL